MGKDRVEVTCPICDKEFLKQKKDVYDNNYCSRKCWDIYRNSLKTTLICEHCNKEYEVELSYIDIQSKRNQNTRFCSKKCFNENIRKNMVEVSCTVCSKLFLRNKKLQWENSFCSNKCKKHYVKENHAAEIKCEYCGKISTTTKFKSDNGQKFCNNRCRNAQRAIDKETYSALAHYLRSSSQYETWRKSVLIAADFTCTKCVMKGVLHAHHIKTLHSICKMYDFDTKKIVASAEFNDVNNGLCLCKKCHTAIHPQLRRNKKGQFCRLDSESQIEDRDYQRGNSKKAKSKKIS